MFKEINLIDRFLVEISLDGEGDYEQHDSGLYTMKQEKAHNYGIVRTIPFIVIEDKYQPVTKMIKLGDYVFFAAHKSYNFLPLDSEKFKMLLIPVWDIDAVGPV